MKKIVLLLLLSVSLLICANLIVAIPDTQISRIKEAFISELQAQGIDNPTNQEVAIAIKEMWKNALRKKVRKYEKMKAEKDAIEALQPLDLEE